MDFSGNMPNYMPVLRRESIVDYIDFHNNLSHEDTINNKVSEDCNKLLHMMDSFDENDISFVYSESEIEDDIHWSFSTQEEKENDDFLTISEKIWDTNIENLSDDFIISEVTENSDNNTECCICFETIDKKKNNCITECGHSFCLKCLATSMYHNNNACPCCRTALVDEPEEEDEDEDDEDYDEDDDDETEIYSEYDAREGGENQYYLDCNVEEVTRRLQSNGFTMTDIVSMLIGRYSRDEKYTVEYINEMSNKFDEILDEADKETYEQRMFAAEDMRDPPSPVATLLDL